MILAKKGGKCIDEQPFPFQVAWEIFHLLEGTIENFRKSLQ